VRRKSSVRVCRLRDLTQSKPDTATGQSGPAGAKAGKSDAVFVFVEFLVPKSPRLKRPRKTRKTVILSEAKNPSLFLACIQTEERFFASLRMTNRNTFATTYELANHKEQLYWNF
jgi:hypothetical protein